MKLVWIQDLIAVAETGTLSRAALLRHSSQPALSRRIQALERWLDVELLDRCHQPVRLTPVAQRCLPELRTLASQIERLRIRMRSEERNAARLVLATQHSLTITRLPQLLEKLDRIRDPKVDLSVLSETHEACMAAFMRGEADLLMCMEQEGEGLQADLMGALRLELGHETFIPVSAVSSQGKPLHRLRPGREFRLLAFPADSFVGRALYRYGLSGLMQEYGIHVVHESTFLAGIKEMAIAGLGAAWLPESMVRRELASGQLIALGGVLNTITLPVILYGNPHTPYAAVAHKVWSLLSQRG